VTRTAFSPSLHVADLRLEAPAPAPADAEIPFARLDHADSELLHELLAAVARVAESGAFTLGEEVDAFEREFAAYCGTEHAVGVSSGTDALALALRALGISPGDEVIVPANSFIATAEAVTLAGARPRLVDVDPASHLLTADILAAAITPRTRAVIPVHLYGCTVDLDPLTEVARSHDIAVVEDACQAHGAHYRGRRAGAVADIGCFSFYPTKNLGGWGDGGAVVTSRPELAERVRLLRSHGEQPRYHHHVCGSTARLDALQAAVLRLKLCRLDGWNAERRALAARLRSALAGTGVGLPPKPDPHGDHVYHLFPVFSTARDALRAHLGEGGIATAAHYPVPIHLAEAYRHLRLRRGALPVAERLAQTTCSLPLWPGMRDDQIDRVAAAVASFDSKRRPGWRPTTSS